jgi:hypothetical protein
VLEIITTYGFEPLMDEEDPKAENMMIKIWNGKESNRCDGSFVGFS